MSVKFIPELDTVRFTLGPRAGQRALVVGIAAYSNAVDSLTLRMDDGSVTYAYSDSVELVTPR